MDSAGLSINCGDNSMRAQRRRPDTLFRASLASFMIVLAALTACSSTPAAEAPVPRIWDAGTGRFVTESELVTALSGVRFRLLGEVHDNPAHHVARARLIT